MKGLPDPVEYGKALSIIVKDYVARATADLERRLALLENKKSVSYRGTYLEGAVYREGEFCTDKNTVWYCRSVETNSRPGESSAWQQVVKPAK